MAHKLAIRQAFDSGNNNGDSGNGNGNGNGNGQGYQGYLPDDSVGNWWWTPAGIATRYAIVAVLFLTLLAFFVGGYLHAQRRIKKGLAPLPYHSWMVRQPRYVFNPPRHAPYAHYGDPNNQYMMEGYPPPPPAYHNAEGPPPTYQPPPGATKAMADQNFHETNRGEGSGSSGPTRPSAVLP